MDSGSSVVPRSCGPGCEVCASHWSQLRRGVVFYSAPMLLVLLFGRQGWFLWHRGQAALTWLRASPCLLWTNLRAGQLISRCQAILQRILSL